MASDEKAAADGVPRVLLIDCEKEECDEQQDHDRIKATARIIQGAKTATEKEHKMTLLQGIRLYPKAIAWSALISTCIVMEGYDVCLINNFCRCSALARATN
jgi:hypothetical protein